MVYGGLIVSTSHMVTYFLYRSPKSDQVEYYTVSLLETKKNQEETFKQLPSKF